MKVAVAQIDMRLGGYRGHLCPRGGAGGHRPRTGCSPSLRSRPARLGDAPGYAHRFAEFHTRRALGVPGACRVPRGTRRRSAYPRGHCAGGHARLRGVHAQRGARGARSHALCPASRAYGRRSMAAAGVRGRWPTLCDHLRFQSRHRAGSGGLRRARVLPGGMLQRRARGVDGGRGGCRWLLPPGHREAEHVSRLRRTRGRIRRHGLYRRVVRDG